MKFNLKSLETGVPSEWELKKVNDVKDFQEKIFKKKYLNTNGIYIIRSRSLIQRIKGSSHILYIGAGNIRVRLVSLFDFAFTKYSSQTKRLHTIKKDIQRIINETNIKIEVLYFGCSLKEDCKKIESNLIQEFCREHIEPPPLNNTRK